MPKLLVIGYVWPEPRSTAAGNRMMQLLQYFNERSYKIVFATTAKETQNKADLQALGIEEVEIKLNDPSFDLFLKKLMPDIVLFDRFMIEEQFGWRVDEICPLAIKILDTEDLHFLRNARHQAYKEHRKVEEDDLHSDLAKREISAMYRCDISLIISEAEMEILHNHFHINENLIFYLPFLLPSVTESNKEHLPQFDEREGFICIGNFLHEPNWRAVLELKENIWPEIRKKLPDTRMNIYGAYATQKVLNLHNPKGNFFVHGWVEDSMEAMKNARVCLAPIQFGAGLKGKLIEAMQCGTPSVTTTIGAEGINGELEWSGYISDDMTVFAGSCVEIFTNKNTWQTKQKLGFNILDKRFDKAQHERRFSRVLSEIQQNLEKHRNLNFTGKMLKHHLHRSTYFMSKFIEEKNKAKN